uniref:BMERB domain-containing protein n=1 Tax=Steinernema glaseri TaxID=37863 RepID=A0A1I8ASP0_9BILA
MRKSKFQKEFANEFSCWKREITNGKEGHSPYVESYIDTKIGRPRKKSTNRQYTARPQQDEEDMSPRRRCFSRRESKVKTDTLVHSVLSSRVDRKIGKLVDLNRRLFIMLGTAPFLFYTSESQRLKRENLKWLETASAKPQEAFNEVRNIEEQLDKYLSIMKEGERVWNELAKIQKNFYERIEVLRSSIQKGCDELRQLQWSERVSNLLKTLTEHLTTLQFILENKTQDPSLERRHEQIMRQKKIVYEIEDEIAAIRMDQKRRIEDQRKKLREMERGKQRPLGEKAACLRDLGAAVRL